MKKIMVYGDSNTWGYYPAADGYDIAASGRYDENTRWPCIMKKALGPDYEVLEEGYCGRTIAFNDPTAYGRSGLQYIEIAFRTCEPVDLIIIMLGTNDLKDIFSLNEVNIGDAMDILVRTLKNSIRESLSPDAQIIIVNPLNVTPCADGSFVYGLSERSVELGSKTGGRFKAVAQRRNCGFFDADVLGGMEMNSIDGTHLTADSHRILGLAMAEYVSSFLKNRLINGGVL